MKKRLHDKKAGTALLAVLVIISLAEVIFRSIYIGRGVLNTSNMGEQIVVIALAVAILMLNAKGKDRICYILYGAWIGYFVLDQLFELPEHLVGLIMTFTSFVARPTPAMDIVAYALKVFSSIGIIMIGVLLVEYLNDGTIFNRAFNTLCIVTVVLLLGNAIIPAYIAIAEGLVDGWLGTFHDLYRLGMVFMFTFFAYDSAKYQLKRVKHAK